MAEEGMAEEGMVGQGMAEEGMAEDIMIEGRQCSALCLGQSMQHDDKSCHANGQTCLHACHGMIFVRACSQSGAAEGLAGAGVAPDQAAGMHALIRLGGGAWRAQVEQALEQLEGDAGVRAEYEDLWSRQRTYPVWQYLGEAEEAARAQEAAAAGSQQARARVHAPLSLRSPRFCVGGMAYINGLAVWPDQRSSSPGRLGAVIYVRLRHDT